MIIRSENTAIRRKKPSAPARFVCEHIIPHLPNRIICTKPSILDYGCGYGADVSFYKNYASYVAGYDPHPKFGYEWSYDKKYDLITCTYVLNAIPDQADRLIALHNMMCLLNKGGCIFIAVRHKNEIESIAKKKSWKKYKDGYYTGNSKKTFQCGFSKRKLKCLIYHNSLYGLNSGCVFGSFCWNGIIHYEPNFLWATMMEYDNFRSK